MKKYIWALIETASTIGFQFLSVIILSRILLPSDYGMIGMMTIFITLGNIFVDAGMGSSLIKKRDADNVDYSTLFWFNFVVACVLYLIFYISAYYLSRFYKIPEFSSCLRVYSLFIVISALGVVQNTQLNKELRFKEMAIISIVANISGLTVAFIMAGMGYGYWSLIVQQLVYISIRVLMQFVTNRFVPQLIFSTSSFKFQFGFGGNIMLASIINVIYNNIIASIIPKIGTLPQNGYYTQASKIQQVPLTIIQSVADKVLFPVLTKCSTEKEILNQARKLLRLVLIIVFFAIGICTLISKYIIWVLLGNEWMEATIYLRILFLACFGSCYQYIVRNIFKSLAKTRLILYTDVVKAILGLIMIFLSMSYGILFMLWGFVFSTMISSIFYVYVLKHSCEYAYSSQLKDMCIPILMLSLTIVIVLFS